ncbi:hypothetical protein EON67_11745, partial [archaeon]
MHWSTPARSQPSCRAVRSQRGLLLHVNTHISRFVPAAGVHNQRDRPDHVACVRTSCIWTPPLHPHAMHAFTAGPVLRAALARMSSASRAAFHTSCAAASRASPARRFYTQSPSVREASQRVGGAGGLGLEAVAAAEAGGAHLARRMVATFATTLLAGSLLACAYDVYKDAQALHPAAREADLEALQAQGRVVSFSLGAARVYMLDTGVAHLAEDDASRPILFCCDSLSAALPYVTDLAACGVRV